MSTVARNKLPKGVPTKYFHKEQTSNADRRAKVARFHHPVVAVKTVEFVKPGAGPFGKDKKSSYQRVHVSFQSTSSTNIQGVNSLNSVTRFVEKRDKGSGKEKRWWVIEQNDARQRYLNGYGGVDTFDGQLERCNIFYITWKYWHAAKRHTDKATLVTAYSFYKECATEPLALESFKIDKEKDKFKVLSFDQFLDRCAKQGLTYKITDCKYPGDKFMRANTVLPKKKRKYIQKSDGSIEARKRGRPKIGEKVVTTATYSQYEEARGKGGSRTRLCGDLTKLMIHHKSITKGGDHNCVVCGKLCSTRCDMCPGRPWMHCHVAKGPNKGCQCFFQYHSRSHFGLTRNDQQELFGCSKSSWKPPTDSEVRSNRKKMNENEKSFIDLNEN